MADGKSMTLCWKCANACGGCSWTERDKRTGKVRFQPVEGWKAVETKVMMDRHTGGYRRFETSYHVVQCPLYKPEKERKKPETFEAKLKRIKRMCTKKTAMGGG